MKNKKHLFLSLPILISAVSICSATSSYAALYKAKTSWTINSEATGDYCSASQGFSEKAYLTFAKRVDGSVSLAVDFQKPTFDKGVKYSFKLKVGGVSQSFKVEPSSENAVVFALGGDNKLINALSGSSILSLNVNGEAHDFSIRDAVNLPNDLSSCVTKIMPAQNTVEKVYDHNPDSVSSDVVVSRSTQDNSAELVELRLENTRLASLLKQVRRDSDSRIAAITSNPYSEEAKEKVFVLEKENRSLKDSLASLSKLSVKLDDVKKVELKLDEEKKKKVSLESDLTLATNKLSMANNEIARLNEQNNKAGEEAIKVQLVDQEKEISALKTENVKFSQQQGELDRLKSENLRLSVQEKEITTLKDDNARLSQQLGEVDILKSENLRLAGQEKEITSLKMANAKLSQQHGELDLLKSENLKFAEQEKEITFLKAENARLSQNSGDIATLNSENLKFEEQEKEIATLKDENAKLLAQVEIYEIAENNSKAGKDSISEEYDLLERRYNTAIVDLEAMKIQNIENDKQVKILENQLVGMMKSDDNKKVPSEVNWNLEKATQRYQEAQREIVNLGRLVEQGSATCDAEKKDIESMLFDPEIAGSEQRIKLASMEGDIDDLRAEKSSLEMQNDTLQKEILDLNRDITAIEVSNVTLVASRVEDELARAEAEKSVGEQVVVKMDDPIEQPIIKEIVIDQPSSYLKELVNTISVTGNMTEQSKNGMNIFRWKKDGLHGIAIEKPLAGKSLSSSVDAYIDRAQSKCNGDFAAVPSLQDANKQMYEIACVKPDGKGSSASLLFLENDNNMITIAHEGRTDLMEQAINARDEISKTVKN